MTESRAYPSRPIVGVGGVVLRDRQVVLVRRRFAPLAGEWTLPGGVVELGETLEGAVTRELLEETGLAIRVGPVVDVFDRIALDSASKVEYHYVIVDYLCEPIAGALKPSSDVSEAVWADIARLEPYRLTDKARAVVARAIAMTAR